MEQTGFHWSSLTRKLVMGMAGLFLITFLVVHLGINLTMLLPDEGVTFHKAVTFMTTNPLIKVMEVFLFGGLFLHMLIGAYLWLKNRMARPTRYYKMNSSKTSFLSKYMLYTGILVAVFLAIHFMNFYFVKLGWVDVPAGISDSHDFYNMAIALFSNSTYSLIYIVLMVVLAFHLYHAFQSAFQTFGWNHTRYTPIIKTLAVIYSVVVPAGFAVIPVYFMLFFKQ
jgi:succinate dehydrogenase / fumarate reductase, cytochrome b subunit